MGSGPIWPRAGFGPKRRIPAFLLCFCWFLQNEQKPSNPIFKKLGCCFFGNPSSKKRLFDCIFTVFSCFRWKMTWLQNPSAPRGGGDQSPKRTKKGQKPAFLLCFLVLHKSEKVASQPHLKRPSCELFGAPGPKEKRKTCIFMVFSCSQEEKTCIFTCF